MKSLDLDLDLGVDMDGLVRRRLTRRSTYQIAPLSVHVHVQVEVQEGK